MCIFAKVHFWDVIVCLSGPVSDQQLYFSQLPAQEHDEPILKHLKDIQVKYSEPGQPMVSICSIITYFVILSIYQ